jgi:hypothetical protein
VKGMFLIFVTAVMILPWLAATRAKAEMIPFTESMTLLGPNPSPDGSVHIYSQNLGPNAQIVLSPAAATSRIAPTWRPIDLVNVTAFDSSGTPGRFGGPSGNYSLIMTLRDKASGASGSLTFRCNFFGSVAQGRGTDDLLDKFLDPMTQTLTVGGNLYGVTIPGFFNPGYVGGGSIDANIYAEALHSAPEPSSLMLAYLGLPSLGLAGWFRRRRA